MTEINDSNRRARGLEPIGDAGERAVLRLRERMAAGAKGAVVTAGMRGWLPRWLATVLIACMGLRGA